MTQQVEIGIRVYCSNERCSFYLRNQKRRHIGVDGGLGGKWQCRMCNAWTCRGATA